MKLYNRQIIYSLKNEVAENHIGEYFQIISFKHQYYLYYNCLNTIKLAISDSLSFVDTQPITVIQDAPGGCFCVLGHENQLYMLCGSHTGSTQETDELPIPDSVWPKEKRTLTDYDQTRIDRKNGMYLLNSQDGIAWKQLKDKPVLHSFISSESCKLGEVSFDTSPYILQHNNEFYYYGRLNSSLDERRIYLRKSTDLVTWSLPERIDIANEKNKCKYIINRKKNYYNPIVFKHNQQLYMLTPYFEACGTEQRHTNTASTLLLQSTDGLKWNIIDSCLPHQGRYKDRVNDIYLEECHIIVFFRENVPQDNQQLVSYNLNM